MLDQTTITKIAADARRKMGVDFVWRPKEAQITRGFSLGNILETARRDMGNIRNFLGQHEEFANAGFSQLMDAAKLNADVTNNASKLRVEKGKAITDVLSKIFSAGEFSKPIASRAGERVADRLFPKKGLKAFMKDYPMVAYPAIGGAALSAGAGIEKGVSAVGEGIHERMTRERDFKSMLDQHAEVAADFQTNPKAVRTAFETIRKYNKEVSSDPLVTGFLVHNAVTGASMQSGTPMMDIETANKLIKMRPESGRTSNLGGAFQHGVEKAMPGVD